MEPYPATHRLSMYPAVRQRLQNLESTLTDINKHYEDKVTALFAVWEHVSTMCTTPYQDIDGSVIEWALQRTLHIILSGEWPELAAAKKTHLNVTLQRCAGLLATHSAAPKCRALINMVNDPWGHPTLRRIVHGQRVTSDEVLTLFHAEMGTVLCVRLEMLCEKKCQDMALNLAETIVRCLNMEGSRLRAGSTEEEIHFFIDVYICLLYRKERIQDLIHYIQDWDMKDVLLLIRRYSEKDAKLQNFRIWKHCGKVSKLVARYFLSISMVNPISQAGPLFKDLIAEWAILNSQKPSFPLSLPGMIRKQILPAESAVHIYTFCEVLVKQFGDVLKPICIELYIRGLTTDMNELEQQKVKQDKEKVHEAELRLSEGFLKLADLVKHNVGVCRECVLTAFSLNPTRACLERIKEMAIASGKCPSSDSKKSNVSQNQEAYSATNRDNGVCTNIRKDIECENTFNKCGIQIDTGQGTTTVDTIENNNLRMILTQIDTNVSRGQDNPDKTLSCRQNRSRTPPVSSRSESQGQIKSPEIPEFSNNQSTICSKLPSPVLPKTVSSSKSLDISPQLCLCKSRTKMPTSSMAPDGSYECNVPSVFSPCGSSHLGDLCPECGGFTGIESSTHNIVTESGMERKERTLDALISIKGNTVTESLNYDVLSAPNQVLDAEALGLTPQLCDDLAVVLSSPRYQMLSWVLDWSELSNLCEKYLENSEDMKNTTKELKFLNIDYNQFKDWPSDDDEKDEYYGIEKGYEQWVDLSSDSDYDFTHSYKKRRRLTESESDSSVIRKRHRRCRKVHRLLSSESDYDSSQRKDRKLAVRRAPSLSVSDSDTGTQDSKSDSLGSDGFRDSKVRKIDTVRRKEESSNTKLFGQESLNDITHFRVVNDDRSNLTSDFSNSDVLSIFSQMDKNAKEVPNAKFSQSFESPLRNDMINTTLSPDKRSSDPTVLKSLRMFRPHNAKKSPRGLTHILKANRIHNKEGPVMRQEDKATYTKFAPMLSTLNLNPRIVLKRADANSPDLKNHKQQTASNTSVDSLPQISSDMLCMKTNSNKNIAYVMGNKNQFPVSYPVVGDKNNKHKLDVIAQAVIDSELLAKTVPGLNSLEMIVPPPLEPTIQVVQFPQNHPSTNSNNSNAESSAQKVETSNTSSSNSSSCVDAGSSSNHQDTIQSPQSSQPRSEDSGQMYQPVSSQPSLLTASQDQEKQKTNSQMDVKYLTKASEVNEILRSTLGGNISQVQTISLVTSPQVSSAGQAKQKLVPQPEVKYLTTASEVTEILRSTLLENTQLNQAVNSPQSTADGHVQSKQKPITRSEVRYLTTTNEVNEILRSTPVTAHIQKIGQPPVASELDGGSSSTIQADPPQVSSRPTFPIVKTVDLNILASLISSAGSNNSGGTDGNQTTNNDSHMVQLFYKKVKPIMCTQNSTRSTQAENDTGTQTQNQTLNITVPSAQTNEHASSTHSLYDDNFHKYPLAAGIVAKSKSSDANSTQVASLPKFQHAFGKSIYNQASTSGSVDNGNNSQTEPGATCEDTSNPPQTTSSSENANQSPEAVSTASCSTVMSKAVQTTAINSSAPASTRISPSESTNTLSVLMNPTLQLNTAGSVVALAQGSVPRHIAGSFKRNNRLPVQTAQSHILYDLHQIPSNVESQAAPGSSSSNHRNTPVKPSQTAETTQHSQEPEVASTSANVTVSSSTISLVNKDSVIRNNMNALLAAALQGSSHRSASQCTTTPLNPGNSLTSEPEICIVDSSSSDDEGTDAATQTLISSVPLAQRIALPVLQKTINRTTAQTSRVVRPVLHIPGSSLIPRNTTTVSGTSTITSQLRQQQVTPSVSVTSSTASTSTSITINARLSSQNVGTTNTLMTPGSMDSSVSSTTLEQLREFESVLEQVTNTSQMKERSTVQPRIQTESINTQQLLLAQASNSSDPNTEFTTNPASSVSSFPQQFNSITATPRVGVTYVTQAPTIRTTSIVPGSTGKISSPVVVVTSYCQPAASPALSVTSQSSSSPCVTPAPASSTSTGKTPPKPSKSSKSKSVKSSSSGTASKASPVPKPQQKPQEDEQTAQRIYAILDEYAEQLRNSPDLNNKPAPRRRSNPPTNPSQSSKRKKSGQTKVKLLGQQATSSAIEMSPGADDPRTMGSEDSSSGIMQLSHIQDSPASSAQTADEPQSLRTTPSLDITSESGSLRTVVSEAGDSQENRQQPRLILTDTGAIQGRAVIVQDAVQQSSDVTVSGNATVVAGKPMMVGSTLPLYVPGSVRQVFLPGLTASVQGRPMVMSKGSKVIRVHQVTVPGASNVQGAALVVRQMCVNKPSVGTSMSMLGQPTVKQVKLPMGSISSQALTGVTAQPPVVLPPGSHHLAGPVAASVATSTLGHAFSFSDSDMESVSTVLQDGTIRSEPSNVIDTDDNTLNTSSAGLIHRGVQSSFHDQISASAASSITGNKITYRSSAQISASGLKLESADVLNTTNGEDVPEEINRNACDEESQSGNNQSVLSIGQPTVSLVSSRQSDSNSGIGANQSSLATFQCLSIGFSRQTGVQECINESTTKSDIIALPACSENDPDLPDDHLSMSSLCKRNDSENANNRLDSALRSKQSEGLNDASETSRSGAHSLEKHNSSQLPDSSCHPRQVIQSERLNFQNTTSNPVNTSTLNEKLIQHDTSSVAILSKDDDFSSVESSRMESTSATSPSMRMVSENESLNSREVQAQHRLQQNFCPRTDSRSSSSSDKEINVHVSSGDIHMQRSNTTNQSLCTHTVTDESNHSKPGALCRTNSQIEFGGDVGYASSPKLANQLDYVSDMTYRLPTKLSTDNSETPWRYVTVPTVKRVHVRHPMITRRGYMERSTEQLGPTLQLTDNNSEVEDSPQERRAYISDAKLDAMGRKSAVGTPVLNAYRKLEGSSQRMEKQVSDRLEPLQQKVPRIEKELKLQKSLSEECEDLGVDEPSTSDLFPEADLLLDTNSSPSFEQMQDTSCNQTVESSEQYSCTNFRPLEYSSSSQEASHLGSPPMDTKSNEPSGSKRGRKRPSQSKTQQYDWKYRTAGRERTRRMVRSSIIHRGESSKLCSSGQDSSVNGSSKDPSPNLIEDSSNGGSKDGFSESTSGTSIQETSLSDSKRVLLEQDHLSDSLQNDGSKKMTDKNSLRKPLSCAKELDDLSLSNSSKQALSDSGTSNMKPFNVASKGALSSPRATSFSGSSSDDIVTMLDSYATNMILSPVDVTIPSPVPNFPTIVPQIHGSVTTQDILPSLTAAQKFANTYRKRHTSGRQDVERVIKRARLNRPNQYFNDHVDSQETWESSSSQEKTCADDEDSGSQSRTEGRSSTPDQPNSDIDVVDLSNDAFPTSSTSYSPVPSPKVGISKSETLDKSLKSFNLNGIDLKDSILLSDKSDMVQGSKWSNKRATRKSFSVLSIDKSETETGECVSKSRRVRKTSQSNIRQIPEMKNIVKSNKAYLSSKQSSTFGTYETRKLIVRAKKMEDCGFGLPMSSYMKPSTTVTNPDEIGDHSVPSRSQLIDKDSICSVDSQCETQLNTLSVSRRSSLRGHIKKGCTCCSVSPQPSKKKKELLKIEKPSKKGQPKGSILKKR